MQVHAKLLLQGEAGTNGASADAAAGGEGGEGGGGSSGGGNAVIMELLAFPQINVVDFGSVHINERSARKVTFFHLSNKLFGFTAHQYGLNSIFDGATHA